MKISKTSTDRANDRKVESAKKTSEAGSSSKSKGKAKPKSKDTEQDTVILSAGALAASNANDVDEIQAIASIDGPLPDPMETSRAILEKEFHAHRENKS